MNILKLKFSLLFCISLAVINSSCSDEDIKIADAGTMVATIDNKEWFSVGSALFVNAFIYNGQIAIIGETRYSKITLIVGSATTGTFSVAGANGSNNKNEVSFKSGDYDEITNPTFSSAYSDEPEVGEIILTEIDEINKTISGRFHCKVSRSLPEEKTVEIKSGSFTKIPYGGNPKSAIDNTFSAKINDSLFLPSIIGGISYSNIRLNFISGNKEIRIDLPIESNVGTFTIGTFFEEYSASYRDNNTPYESVSGSVTIGLHDKINQRIEGTFSFESKSFISDEEVSVTEGSFAVFY